MSQGRKAESLLRRLFASVAPEPIFIDGNYSAMRHCFFCIEDEPNHADDCIYVDIEKFLRANQTPTELEITEDIFHPKFFERSPFLIPRINAEVEAPTISIERHLNLDEIKKTADILRMIASHRNLDEQLGIGGREYPESFSFLNETAADAKEYHVKQDLDLLVDLVDRYFDHELKKIAVTLDNLPDDIIQIVKVDFTMIDLYPGDTEIHYRLYTKRGIGRAKKDI
jgi:hypothetical protein